jgi:hypothetical protein
MEPNQNLLSTDLQMDSIVQSHLKETAMWARFLGIIGFVLTGFIAIAAFFMGTIIGNVMRTNPYAGSGGDVTGMLGGFITVIYLILAVVMFFISLFTYRFGVRTKAAILSTDQESLYKGMLNLKLLFRTYGIIMVIYLAFILLALIGGVFGAMMGR